MSAVLAGPQKLGGMPGAALLALLAAFALLHAAHAGRQGANPFLHSAALHAGQQDSAHRQAATAAALAAAAELNYVRSQAALQHQAGREHPQSLQHRAGATSYGPGVPHLLAHTSPKAEAAAWVVAALQQEDAGGERNRAGLWASERAHGDPQARAALTAAALQQQRAAARAKGQQADAAFPRTTGAGWWVRQAQSAHSRAGALAAAALRYGDGPASRREEAGRRAQHVAVRGHVNPRAKAAALALAVLRHEGGVAGRKERAMTAEFVARVGGMHTYSLAGANSGQSQVRLGDPLRRQPEPRTEGSGGAGATGPGPSALSAVEVREYQASGIPIVENPGASKAVGDPIARAGKAGGIPIDEAGGILASGQAEVEVEEDAPEEPLVADAPMNVEQPKAEGVPLEVDDVTPGLVQADLGAAIPQGEQQPHAAGIPVHVEEGTPGTRLEKGSPGTVPGPTPSTPVLEVEASNNAYVGQQSNRQWALQEYAG